MKEVPKLRKRFGIAKGTIEIKGDIIETATDLAEWEVLKIGKKNCDRLKNCDRSN